MDSAKASRAELVGRAVSLLGSEAKLAAAAGVAQATINEAKHTGTVGPKLAMGLDRATGGRISRSALRPDLWPPAEGEGSL
jgi:DNA-binding transcriptional regulator YdaS (Cro superfamily)